MFRKDELLSQKASTHDLDWNGRIFMENSNSENDIGMSAVTLPETFEDGCTIPAMNIIVTLEKKMPFPVLVGLLSIEEIDD